MMPPPASKEAKTAREPGQPRKRRKSAVYDADGHEVLISLMCIKCRTLKPLAQFGLRPAEYPALYVTAGLNDPRVSYHEPAKWVARLREVDANLPLENLRTVEEQVGRLLTQERLFARLCSFFGGLALLLGSTASGVLHGAKCDVLAVRI